MGNFRKDLTRGKDAERYIAGLLRHLQRELHEDSIMLVHHRGDPTRDAIFLQTHRREGGRWLLAGLGDMDHEWLIVAFGGALLQVPASAARRLVKSISTNAPDQKVEDDEVRGVLVSAAELALCAGKSLPRSLIEPAKDRCEPVSLVPDGRVTDGDVMTWPSIVSPGAETGAGAVMRHLCRPAGPDCGSSFEVKRDDITHSTRRFFIEIGTKDPMCATQVRTTGLMKTRSYFYTFVLGASVLWVPSKALGRLTWDRYKFQADRRMWGGDGKRVLGIMLSIDEVLSCAPTHTTDTETWMDLVWCSKGDGAWRASAAAGTSMAAA